ncbi:MFS transporter [Actinokineospora pegani]|uniref:MFS transporter n=1 Tax=Actinokineospora pegani TaxID=2654637 RepID=UPI0012EA233C|nr:MFS transporter [Actinokineospora pegani]
MTSTVDVRAAQRRTLSVLVVSQVFSGLGLGAGITVGALLAQDLLGSTGLSGLPSALFTAGAAVAAAGVGRLSNARGRRPGLAAGYATGTLGSAGVVVAAVTGSVVLLVVSLMAYGAATATNLQARYAGADLAEPGHGGRAVSRVLVTMTLGGVLGPTLAEPTGNLADALGIPRLAGPFLLSGVAYAIAALVLVVFLRPDPLLLAKEVAAHADPGDTGADSGGHRAGMALGAVVMGLTQVVMVAIMTMTPIHLHDHGHSTAASGLVIAVHIAAMYLPSPLSGRLVDRCGPHPVAVSAGLVLLLAGVVAAVAPPSSVWLVTVALGLLGLGYNLGLVSGTAIITSTVPLAVRAKAQGSVDVTIAISGAAGGLSSGFVVAGSSFTVLALGSGVLALALVPVVLVGMRRVG